MVEKKKKPEDLELEKKIEGATPTGKPLEELKKDAGIGVFKSEATGQPAGIELPDGRVFLGLNPNEVREIAERETARRATPTGTMEIPLQRKIEEQQQVAQALYAPMGKGVGDTGTEAPKQQYAPEMPNIDYRTAALAAPAIAGGMAAGGALGIKAGTALAPFTSGVSIPVGVAVGAAIGGISVFLAKVGLDRKQIIKETYKTFQVSSTQRNKQLLNIANSGTSPPADIIAAYEKNLNNIRLARARLKDLSKNKFAEKLSAAQDELIEVEAYLENEPFTRADLYYAIQNPNPNRIYQETEQITAE